MLWERRIERRVKLMTDGCQSNSTPRVRGAARLTGGAYSRLDIQSQTASGTVQEQKERERETESSRFRYHLLEQRARN